MFEIGEGIGYNLKRKWLNVEAFEKGKAFCDMLFEGNDDRYLFYKERGFGMRRIAILCLSFFCFVGFCACGGKRIDIDYGDSALYDKKDRKAAIAVIQEAFEKLEGCELLDVLYGGDEASTEGNLEEYDTTQYICFTCIYETPKDVYSVLVWLERQSEHEEWILTGWPFG